MTTEAAAAVGGFADLHCHLLPGVDDGPEDLPTALELCRKMVAEGVSVATATPHINHHYPANRADSIRVGVEQLRAALAEAGVPLEVLPGADIRVDTDFMARWGRGELLSVADRGRYVLLELPDNVLYPLDGLSFQLRLKRVTPILTHPERCEPLQRDWSVLREWVEQGMVLQVTTGSLLGEFGSKAQRIGEEMIDAGLVGFLASDAHGPTRRPPNHRAAFAHVSAEWGRDIAERLMLANPAAILAGKAVAPVVVEPPKPAAPSGGFWSRLGW